MKGSVAAARAVASAQRSRSIRNLLLVALVVGIGILGLAVELQPEPVPPTGTWLLDLCVGVALAVVGAVLVGTGPRVPAGWVLLAGGVAWFAGNAAALDPMLVDVVGPLTYVHRGLVVAGVLLLRAPRLARVAATGIVVSALVPFLTVPPAGVLVWALFVLAVGIFVTRGWPGRSRVWAALSILLATGAAGSVAAVSLVGGLGVEWSQVATWGYDAGFVFAGLACLGAAADLRARPVPVADAVLRLAADRSGPVRGLLADALRDPGLELAFATATGGWVDETGVERPRVPDGTGRDRVTVSVAGEVVAELSCRTDVARAIPVVRAIEAASRLVASNALLRTSLRHEADGLRDSQRRLLQVQDDERKALEERLTATVAVPLAMLDKSLAAVQHGRDSVLDAARERCLSRQLVLEGDLHHLVAGLGPASLHSGGLDEAVRALTAPLDIAVSLRLDASTLEPVVATTAYLLCAEAVANVVKHADARRLDVSIVTARGQLEVVVSDDGRGGVDPTLGTGLAGLADRVGAFGGSLRVSSPLGGGTTVHAVLPIDGDPERQPGSLSDDVGQALPIRVQRMP